MDVSASVEYGAGRQRYKQVNVNGAVTETTIYVQNSLFEKITSGTDTEYKHQVIGGDGAAAIHTRRNPGSSDTVYLLTDHLGSVDKVTHSSGSILVNLSYDAFGKRRGASWSGNPSSGDWTVINDNTHRGYTGHEHLDNLSLIHMNGRVYDPDIGRFLSADPFIPGLFNGQSFNRYSYVRNNPLSFTDPSGFEPVFRWCLNCDSVKDLFDDMRADFEASLFYDDVAGNQQYDPTFNGTVIPHPERHPQDDWKAADEDGTKVIDELDMRRQRIIRGDIGRQEPTHSSVDGVIVPAGSPKIPGEGTIRLDVPDGRHQMRVKVKLTDQSGLDRVIQVLNGTGDSVKLKMDVVAETATGLRGDTIDLTTTLSGNDFHSFPVGTITGPANVRVDIQNTGDTNVLVTAKTLPEK